MVPHDKPKVWLEPIPVQNKKVKKREEKVKSYMLTVP